MHTQTATQPPYHLTLFDAAAAVVRIFRKPDRRVRYCAPKTAARARDPQHFACNTHTQTDTLLANSIADWQPSTAKRKISADIINNKNNDDDALTSGALSKRHVCVCVCQPSEKRFRSEQQKERNVAGQPFAMCRGRFALVGILLVCYLLLTGERAL